MSHVICSCLLGDNTEIRLRLSQLLHSEIDDIYGESPEAGEQSSGVCEVEMQGSRREFFGNQAGLSLSVGQQVIVATDGGYDYGVVY